MSGGSMDYIYIKVIEAAGMAHDREVSYLLEDAAAVLKAQEWWYSSDITEAEYLTELQGFKRKWLFGVGNREERLRTYVDEALDRCRTECYSAIGIG